MRDVKFRVWTGNQLHYVTHDADLQLNFGINDGWALWEPYGEICSHKEGELMQYTGLKDKNGKEIYEGDIGEGEHATYVIQWDAKMAQYKAKIITTKSVLSKNCSFPLWQYVEDDGKCRFEVIGNIYENGDLLEDKHDN